jgi:hypothetical protein
MSLAAIVWIYVAIDLAAAALVGWVAGRRGRSVVGWALAALLLHLIALLVLFAMPSKNLDDAAAA